MIYREEIRYFHQHCRFRALPVKLSAMANYNQRRLPSISFTEVLFSLASEDPKVRNRELCLWFKTDFSKSRS
jgi:hypothetical protein